MRKIITVTTITALTLFAAGSFVDARANATVAPSLTTTLQTENATSPTATIVNKLLNNTKQEQQNQTERLTKLKAAADKYIQERLTSIQNRITKISSSKLVSSTLGQQQITELTTESQGLTNLKQQIDAFNDPTAITTGLLPLIKEIFTGYRVYEVELPKTSALLHIQDVQNMYNNLQILSKNISDDVAYAQSQGKNVTTITADENKFNTDSVKLNSDITAAQSALNALTPQGWPANESVLGTLKTMFTKIHEDVTAVKNDFHQFVTDFKALFAQATTTPSVTEPTATGLTTTAK